MFRNRSECNNSSRFTAGESLPQPTLILLILNIVLEQAPVLSCDTVSAVDLASEVSGDKTQPA